MQNARKAKGHQVFTSDHKPVPGMDHTLFPFSLLEPGQYFECPLADRGRAERLLKTTQRAQGMLFSRSKYTLREIAAYMRVDQLTYKYVPELHQKQLSGSAKTPIFNRRHEQVRDSDNKFPFGELEDGDYFEVDYVLTPNQQRKLIAAVRNRIDFRFDSASYLLRNLTGFRRIPQSKFWC